MARTRARNFQRKFDSSVCSPDVRTGATETRNAVCGPRPCRRRWFFPNVRARKSRPRAKRSCGRGTPVRIKRSARTRETFLETGRFLRTDAHAICIKTHVRPAAMADVTNNNNDRKIKSRRFCRPPASSRRSGAQEIILIYKGGFFTPPPRPQTLSADPSRLLRTGP